MRLNEELANEVLLRMNNSVLLAEAAPIEKARIDPTLTGRGATITVACSFGANLLIAHRGDSQAYLSRKGRVYRLTSGHTVAQALRRRRGYRVGYGRVSSPAGYIFYSINRCLKGGHHEAKS